ncbi:metallopeptidase family protein [Phaeacidiphilus oryzae]|uniref:metallopeptidase family protein n=1 Tax=Phaeacidiphilus oryzae TaxID=348818 RepID=UPI0005691985|nr:metallopeptidase family protein [Phaeacidiphilus oryzae]
MDGVQRRRRRDRHGRGLRGPLAPPQIPIALTRSELFDDYVRESVERLERMWPELADVEFAVQEVPTPEEADSAGGAEGGAAGGRAAESEEELLARALGGWGAEEEPDEVPLARTVPARRGEPVRIVVYRRPVEIRARGREERAALVHDVVVEQVAELLGKDPEDVDPRYGE